MSVSDGGYITLSDAHYTGMDDLSLIKLPYTVNQNDPAYKLFRSVRSSE